MEKILCVIFLSCMALVAAAQDRYIVAPNREAIPVGPNESALQVAKQHGLIPSNSMPPPCGPFATVGHTGPDVSFINFGFSNGDVSLQRLIAPVTGVIDSIYFRSYVANSVPDSSCAVRIFRSNWTSANPGPSGIVCWGYYRWPSDPSGYGTSPYVDDPGVDTNFVSNTPGAFNPNGPEIWGLGGYRTTWHRADYPGYVNGITDQSLGAEPVIPAGQAFNVCIRLPSVASPPNPDRSEMMSVSTDISTSGFMKFYYRGRTPGDSTTFGWWHREYTMDIWVVMRSMSSSFNVPPLADVFDTLSRRVCVAYCDSVIPNTDSVFIKYSVNNGEWRTVRFRYESGQWCAVIPGQPYGSVISYRVCSASGAQETCTSNRSYRVIGINSLNRDGYTITINAPYSFVDITGAGGGTQIPVNAFFNTAGPNDDGTAGPFDLRGIFTGLFGRAERYAWIGVNGAICLSNSPTDTVRVGNGFSLYNVPTTAAPRNFIGAFWNDLIIGTGGNGSIWYKVSGTQFIVQWNHIGNFNAAGDTLTTFQMILDRGTTPQTITFQYQNVGTTTLPTDGVIALQDTVSNTSKYVYINRLGYPSETRARNFFAIKLAYTGTTQVQQPSGETPLQFSLSANYPNPFNPVTNFQFSIANPQLTILKVFNMLGQEVATLVNELKQAGTYTVSFDAGKLASGVYFYRLQAGGFVQTMKMLLVR